MLRSSELPETFGRRDGLFRPRRGGVFRLPATQRRMNQVLQLGRSRVNGLGQRKSLVDYLQRLQRTQVSFHAAAHIAIAGVMRAATTEMDLHERHSIQVILQRPLDYALDPDRQFLAAVDVLIRVDPNLHLHSA
jgi:hypothetical protein